MHIPLQSHLKRLPAALRCRAVHALALLTAGGAILASGCASVPSYEVKVTTHASPAAIGKRTYVLYSGDQRIPGSDPRFHAFGTYLVRALRAHGMLLRYSADGADVAIFLYYHIGAPREHQYTYSVPVAHKHSYEYTTPNESQEFCYGSDGCDTVTTFTPETHHSTYYTYDNETRTGSYETYLRSIRIVAVDLDAYRATGKAPVLWQTDILSRGSSNDLASVFPILIAAAEPYIATDAGSGIEISLQGDDPRILAIEGGNP